MSKIRINELARQLEVKSREVIDKLHELGIAEKVTHSSSIDEDKADQLRRYYNGEPLTPAPAAHRNGAPAAVEEIPPAEKENVIDRQRARVASQVEHAAPQVEHAAPQEERAAPQVEEHAAPAPPKRARAVPPPAEDAARPERPAEKAPEASAGPAAEPPVTERSEAEKTEDENRPRAMPLRPPIGRGSPIHPPVGAPRPAVPPSPTGP
ncbi:MAG TPA: translation initiation factor IF-2 N-terminal domain-containing protein, partial [Bryobacteraceae bacterium]|nr:translation initiation factor IF-2 N-terminal domain-containing protein [Bryobacteraceae bacterium]